jgi:Holliday junction DNA helicase RuvA
MLSGMEADEIVAAIRTENLAKLTSIPGVGRKTAERIVVELRDKIGDLIGGANADGTASASSSTDETDAFDDALSALVNLGYQRSAAEKALQQARKDGTENNVQKLLRAALQRLAK